MINNASSREENTTSTVWPHLYHTEVVTYPWVEAANNRTEFSSMTAVGINTVVAVAVLSNNIVLLITLARTRKLWNSTNAYIASLAAADLLLGIMLIVRNFWIIPETSWVFHNNEYVCMPIVCLLYVSCLESITCLAMVSLDRYAYIVWPFWYERHVNKRLITISIALSWVVCIAFGFLPMRLNKFTTDSGCDPLSIISREYLLFGMNFYLFAAEVLIAAMYGRIYCVGNHQRKKIEASTGGFARQRLNSKASREGVRVDCGVCESVAGCNSGSMEATVAVIDLTLKHESARDSHLSSISKDVNVFNSLHRNATPNDAFKELSCQSMASSLEHDETDGQLNTTLPINQEAMVETGKTRSGTESSEDSQKSIILERMTKLKRKKLKKFSFSSTRDSIAARWQVIRFLILVCGTFFLCWMPLQIISILYFTVGTPVIAISVGISFAAINSALNIYILIAMNKTFKAALFGMICPKYVQSRIGLPNRWRKEDAEFVSDYNHAPRPSLQEKDYARSENGSPNLVDSTARQNRTQHCSTPRNLGDGSVGSVENGSTNYMDPNSVVGGDFPNRKDSSVLEDETYHQVHPRPIEDQSPHPGDSVPVSPERVDSVADVNGHPHQVGGEAGCDGSPNHTYNAPVESRRPTRENGAVSTHMTPVDKEEKLSCRQSCTFTNIGFISPEDSKDYATM